MNLKKFTIILLLTLLGSGNMFSQDFKFGIKAGIHYNFSGNLKQINGSETTVSNALSGAENIEGYHGGIYVHLKFPKLFFQPEMVYSQYKNAFDTADLATLTNRKIDFPVLMGWQLFPALYVNAGPDFQYLLPPDFSISTTEVSYKDFTTGLHLGFGVRIHKLSLDVRYERGLTPNEMELIGESGNTFLYDDRPNRLMFSLQLDM